MMDQISTDDVRQLITGRDGPLVSLYVPMVRMGAETRQNPIRFKQVVTDAVDDLESTGMRRPDAEAFMEPAAKMVDDHDFWQHQEDGLAVFVDEKSLRRFRLPAEFETFSNVADRFHVKPLLPIVDAGGEFYVLAISHDHIRLLRGTRYRVSELDLGDIPTSLADALWYKDPEAALQHHTTGPGGTAAAFHGHGLDGDSSKEDLQDFFRAVDAGVSTIISDPRAPVVLAGVDYLLPLYRETSSLEVLPGGVEGNPDETSVEGLHGAAWPLVAGLFDARRIDAHDRFMSTTTESLDDITEIVPAAASGRVETLFVPSAGYEWGTFDEDTFDASATGDGNVDLYDVAAAATWRNGGAVFVVDPSDIPGDAPVAATLRY